MATESKGGTQAATEDQTKTPAAPAPQPAPAEAAKPDDRATARAEAAEIAAMCASAGVPQMAAELIRQGVGLEEAKRRTDAAGAIRSAVAAGNRLNASAVPLSLADDLIRQGASAETARAALFDRLVAQQSPEISAAPPPASQAPAASWSGVVAKLPK